MPGPSRAISRRDVELFRADPVERRQRAAEHVVPPAEGAGALQRPQIGEVFDDADRRRVARRIAADRAGIDGVEIAADRLHGRIAAAAACKRRRQRRHQSFAPLDQMQRGAPRRTRPEPRQPGQQLDQRVEFGQRSAS